MHPAAAIGLYCGASGRRAASDGRRAGAGKPGQPAWRTALPRPASLKCVLLLQLERLPWHVHAVWVGRARAGWLFAQPQARLGCSYLCPPACLHASLSVCSPPLRRVLQRATLHPPSISAAGLSGAVYHSRQLPPPGGPCCKLPQQLRLCLFLPRTPADSAPRAGACWLAERQCF